MDSEKVQHLSTKKIFTNKWKANNIKLNLQLVQNMYSATNNRFVMWFVIYKLISTGKYYSFSCKT